MNIAEVCKRYDISADTVRYYERIGLLPPVNRNASGIRDFAEDDCNWVQFIKCMRSAGVSVEALIEYVKLFRQGNDTVKARKEILIEQRNRLAEKVATMEEVLMRLEQKIEGYEERMVVYEEQLKKEGDNK